MEFSAKIFVLLPVLLCVQAVKLPSGIRICKSKDIDCTINTVQDALSKMKNGYPELGFQSFDPLSIPKLTIGGGNIIQLVQNYENVQIIGLSNSKVTQADFDLDKGKLSFAIEAPQVIFNATYSVKGKVLVMEVYGTGNCVLDLEKVTATFVMDLETFTKNNEKFLKGTKAVSSLQCQHATFQFDNLFDGNKQLGDNINKVLNDNWKQLIDEMAGSYAMAIGLSVMDLANKVFTNIPMKELFLD